MDIRFLQSLLTVIDTGSIASAARKENITAAAISQRIKTLENTFKCELLTRSGHSAKPTDDCLRLLPRLKKIIKQVEFLAHDLDTTELSGVLNVGVISSVLSGLLPRCIQYLAIKTPHILLKITPGSSQELYRKLIEQKIDLAIVVTPPYALPKVIKNDLLFREPLVLISTNKHTDIPTALNQPFIRYDREAWGGAIVQQFIENRQLVPSTLCEIDSLESIVLMVKQNMGVALIPQWEGLKAMAPELININVKDQSYDRSISLLTHRQTGKNKLLETFKHSIFHSII